MSVWFVTGASRGLGRAIVDAALTAGDEVVATARSTAGFEPRDGLLVVPLDVTDAGQAESAVAQAVSRFGRIDVLVNNAGYGVFGAVEEASDAEVRTLFDTNVFGLLNVLRAALPTLRAQRSGHVVDIGSSAGFAAGPGRGLYGASKAAVEGLTEALRGELAPLGVHVTVVEPGSMRTGFLSGGSVRQPEREIPAYAGTSGRLREALAGADGRQPGDPGKAAAAIRLLAASDDPPLRLPLGSDSVALVEEKLALVATELERWREVALSTDRPAQRS